VITVTPMTSIVFYEFKLCERSSGSSTRRQIRDGDEHSWLNRRGSLQKVEGRVRMRGVEVIYVWHK
jgi:hypothetical protein